MLGAWLIYGAAGRTGECLARAARAAGLEPRLAGRSEPRLAHLARTLGLPYSVLSLEQPEELRATLRGCSLLLNAAGPFAHSVEPCLAACLAVGVHYLDIGGEIDAIARVARCDASARDQGLMLMPAVGFDVVASDCLSVHLQRRLPGACTLRIGLSGLGKASQGSARTLALQAMLPVRIRRAGRLESVQPGAVQHSFDFGKGSRPAFAVSWGDVVTAHFSTGIANIETYFEATPELRIAIACQRWLQAGAAFSPLWAEFGQAACGFAAGLDASFDESGSGESGPVIAAEAEDAFGKRCLARLNTSNVYDFTVASALAVTRRVLQGDFEPGFQTPARVYGADLVLAMPDVRRTDL